MVIVISLIILLIVFWLTGNFLLNLYDEIRHELKERNYVGILLDFFTILMVIITLGIILIEVTQYLTLPFKV